MLTEEAVTFLEDRGIDVEVASNLGVSSKPGVDGGDLVFPFFVNGDIVNRKYRNLRRKQFSQDEGGQQVFWNFDCLSDETLFDEPLVIVEGELDAISAIQCGFVRTVSVPSGAPPREMGDEETDKYKYLAHAASLIRGDRVREIILAVDGDEKGGYLLNDLVRRLGPGRCKYVVYPKRRDGSRCKDLNEALMTYGKVGVRKTIENAQWMQVKGIYRMSQLPPAKERRGYDTGFDWLHIKLRPGDFSVVTGVPGHGKTSFVNDLMCRMVDRHGWRIAIASFEQDPQTDHKRALRNWKLGRPVRECTKDEVDAADDWIDENFRFIVPDEESPGNVRWVLEMAATAVVRDDVNMIIIDPWNEVEHDRPRDMSLTEYVGACIRDIKSFAKRMNAHVMVIAHPTKLARNAAGEVPMPTLYDISDSAHWYNKPDLGVVIHRPKRDQAETILAVEKSRYHDEIGKPALHWMRYNAHSRRFEESPPPDDVASAHRAAKKS